MSAENELKERSASSCELCGSTNGLTVFAVAPSDGSADRSILICETCSAQINNPGTEEANHWRCLNESMWSTVPAVQVMAWRMLTRLRSQGWTQDLLDTMYLDEETLTWAQAGVDEAANNDDKIKHIDSNGSVLQNGDTVVIIKDLDIKGSQFAAKRGTSVRNINLIWDNAEQIEGRVNGQTIVILTKYVKKAG
jgi:protein PhnA